MTDAHLQRLAVLGADLRCELGPATLEQIADLTLRLHQQATRKAGAILTSLQARSFHELGETEREGMAAAVRHVVTALVLLDIIELPNG